MPRVPEALALERFRWAVQALAQPAAIQLELFPEFACAADELALDFEEQHGLVSEWSPFDAQQAELVQALDQQLLAMSGPVHAELWTDEALRTAPEWTEVRSRAERVLRALEWPNVPPPRDRAIYVGPPS